MSWDRTVKHQVGLDTLWTTRWIRDVALVTSQYLRGEWPDADSETRSIIDAALGSVPRLCPMP
jgi:hypothetical protein